MAIPRLLRPSAVLRRNALYRGLLGGSSGWLAVGGLIVVKRLLKRAFGKEVEVVTVEQLDPGQAMRIDAVEPQPRRRGQGRGQR